MASLIGLENPNQSWHLVNTLMSVYGCWHLLAYGMLNYILYVCV